MLLSCGTPSQTALCLSERPFSSTRVPALHVLPSGRLLRRMCSLGSCHLHAQSASLQHANRRQRGLAFICAKRVVAVASSTKQEKYDSVIPPLDASRAGQLLKEWLLDVYRPKALKEKWLYIGLTMAKNGSLKRVCSEAHAVLGTYNTWENRRDHLEAEALLLLPSTSGPGGGKPYLPGQALPKHVHATIQTEFAFMQAGFELAQHSFIGGMMNKAKRIGVGTEKDPCDWGSSVVYIVAGATSARRFTGNKWDSVNLQVMHNDTTRRFVPCAADFVLNHCTAETMCRFAKDGDCEVFKRFPFR